MKKRKIKYQNRFSSYL